MGSLFWVSRVSKDRANSHVCKKSEDQKNQSIEKDEVFRIPGERRLK